MVGYHTRVTQLLLGSTVVLLAHHLYPWVTSFRTSQPPPPAPPLNDSIFCLHGEQLTLSETKTTNVNVFIKSALVVTSEQLARSKVCKTLLVQFKRLNKLERLSFPKHNCPVDSFRVWAISQSGAPRGALAFCSK